MTVDRYAVFGNPIAHSKSPVLQQAFAQQTQQAIHYTAVQVEDFESAARDFFAEGGKGLNITVPFKQDAFNFAEQLSERAQRAGAVNTLSISADNKIIGDNTDGVGLVNDITEYLGWPIKDQNILILGAGGAVRGVLQPLIEQQPASMVLANRTVAKAEAIANDFADLFSIQPCGFMEIKAAPFDLIINATSASLAGELPPLPTEIVSPVTACYDMMYAKEPTPFLHWAQQQGANKLSDGLGMLVCQGAESFFIWRGVQPNVEPVISELRLQL